MKSVVVASAAVGLCPRSFSSSPLPLPWSWSIVVVRSRGRGCGDGRDGRRGCRGHCGRSAPITLPAHWHGMGPIKTIFSTNMKEPRVVTGEYQTSRSFETRECCILRTYTVVQPSASLMSVVSQNSNTREKYRLGLYTSARRARCNEC